MHQRNTPQKPPTKVKRTRKELKTTLENKKKVATDSPRSVLKRKNRVEEGKALGLRVEREHESTNLRAQKMMRGKMEPFVVPIVVKAVPLVVQTIR
jgi:hypothetical protein